MRWTEINEKLSRNRQDITYRSSVRDKGLQAAGYHPVTIIQREIEDIFSSMGFEILDGPYIEDEFHNFEALNIPDTHPARDMQDTFWFQDMQTPSADSYLLYSGQRNGDPQAPLQVYRTRKGVPL